MSTTEEAPSTVERALDLIDQLAKFNASHQMHYEIKKLRGIKRWALNRLGVDYAIGDRVRLRSGLFTGPEDVRRAYREAASEGATARVVELDFNPMHDYWYAGIVLDDEWATMPDGTRVWHGPAVETPLGMVEPSPYDRERHPEGTRHVFAVHVQQIEKVTD